MSNSFSEQELAQLREQLLPYLISTRGIKNVKEKFLCPSPSHQDHDPSASYDARRNRWKCFSCGVSGTLFDLVAYDYQIPNDAAHFPAIVKKTKEVLGAPERQHINRAPTKQAAAAADALERSKQAAENIQAYTKKAAEQVSKTDYWHRRGLSDETIRRFNLGFDPTCRNFFGKPAVVIPTSDMTAVVRQTGLEPNSKTEQRNPRYKCIGSKHLFNAAALQQKRPVFIVEGEIDALSIEECGYPAIALGGAAQDQLLLRALKSEDALPCPGVILLFDDDDAGKAGLEEMKKQLDTAGVNFFAIEEAFREEEAHDANALLQKDRARLESFLSKAESDALTEFSAKTQQAAAEYCNTHRVKECLSRFLEQIGTRREPIPTGFQKLDEELGGGLYPGLIVLGAVSALGKTAFALQWADQIAKRGKDILFFSLEMSRYELLSRSISRLTFEKGGPQDASTALWILNGRVMDDRNDDAQSVFYRALESYEKEFAEHLFIEEGVGNISVSDIRKSVEAHIAATGQTPVVFVDYLQILSPFDPRADAKTAVDKAVLELKRLSRDKDTPVVVISSFNRQSYTTEATMTAFKESGAIEYSSDVLIGLQLQTAKAGPADLQEAMRQDERQVEAVLLKNRNGRSGSKLTFTYRPKFNVFTER